MCHTPQFKMLVFAFQSEIWIAENFNLSVFEVVGLSLSWKYRFSQNVNYAKVQSKTNKYCKFHFDLTRKGLSKSRFKKLGMVPKKLYRKHLNCCHGNSECVLTPENPILISKTVVKTAKFKTLFLKFSKALQLF